MLVVDIAGAQPRSPFPGQFTQSPAVASVGYTWLTLALFPRKLIYANKGHHSPVGYTPAQMTALFWGTEVSCLAPLIHGGRDQFGGAFHAFHAPEIPMRSGWIKSPAEPHPYLAFSLSS